MTRNMTIPLDAQSERFVDAQIRTGRYGSAADVVRAGLRLLEHHEAEAGAVRAALLEGEASGISTRSVSQILATIEDLRQPT